jgi:hypothetical protein
MATIVGTLKNRQSDGADACLLEEIYSASYENAGNRKSGKVQESSQSEAAGSHKQLESP